MSTPSAIDESPPHTRTHTNTSTQASGESEVVRQQMGESEIIGGEKTNGERIGDKDGKDEGKKPWKMSERWGE